MGKASSAWERNGAVLNRVEGSTVSLSAGTSGNLSVPFPNITGAQGGMLGFVLVTSVTGTFTLRVDNDVLIADGSISSFTTARQTGRPFYEFAKLITKTSKAVFSFNADNSGGAVHADMFYVFDAVGYGT